MEVASLSLFTEAISAAYVKNDCCISGEAKERKKNTGFTNVKVMYSARNAWEKHLRRHEKTTLEVPGQILLSVLMLVH